MTLPSFTALLPTDAQPRVLPPEAWQALCALHADIERARADLDATVVAQREECERARVNAEREGLAAGRQLAAAELVDVLARLRQAREESSRELIALMFAAVERMFGDAGADLITPKLAEQALREQTDAQSVVAVRVHPQVRDAVQARVDAWSSQRARLSVDVRADDSLDVRACEIETLHGCVRAGLADQLATLKGALLDAGERAVA